jgi:small subunit ribosomal protein S3
MGQKVNPISLRIKVIKNWPVRWFFGRKTGPGGKYSYARFLKEDEAIRRVIQKKIGQAGIAAVEIERTMSSLRILIKAARPGLIIGQGGKGIEELTKAIEKEIAPKVNLSVNVEELKRSEVSAQYIAQQIAWDLEKRFPFRRTIKKYLDQIMQNKEVKGAKIAVAGRLDGAEIARRESLKKGMLPLHTLRADIDYGQATAYTTYGTIGVRVWIYKGEVFNKRSEKSESHPNSPNSIGGIRMHS